MISLEGEIRQFKKMFHQMYRLHRSVITSNTAIGSINMTGNTLTNVSVPVHDHDAAVEFYLYPTVSTALVHSVKPELTE